MASLNHKNAHRIATAALASQDDGRVAEAISTLREASRRDPDNAPLIDLLGDLLVRTSDLSAAIDHYRRAADAYERDGHFNKAVAVWRKVLRVRPDLLDVHVWLADLYVRAGRKADAKRVYENMLADLQGSRLVAMPNIVTIIRNRLAQLEA